MAKMNGLFMDAQEEREERFFIQSISNAMSPEFYQRHKSALDELTYAVEIEQKEILSHESH